MAVLYFGDNGRVTCAAPRCAGATATANGMKRDLNGTQFMRVPADFVRDMEADGIAVTCETCKAAPSLVTLA